MQAPMAKRQNLAGKTYIVSGASEGSLGFATALTLLQWGATVIVTKRSDADALKPLLTEWSHGSSERLFAYDLELASAQSVSSFIQIVNNQHNVDVLINNAGIHLDLLSKWKEPTLSQDGFEIHWRTNYLGTCQLTVGLLPLLRKTAAFNGEARIVNVVSMLHDKGCNEEFFNPMKPYNSWQAYGQSKLGLMHLTTQLNKLYGAEGLHTYSLHPGAVLTNVAAKGLSGHPLVESLRKIFSFIEGFFLKTPEEGAQTQLHLATAPVENLVSGQYYRQLKLAPVSNDARDDAVSVQLWDELAEHLATMR